MFFETDITMEKKTFLNVSKSVPTKTANFASLNVTIRSKHEYWQVYWTYHFAFKGDHSSVH